MDLIYFLDTNFCMLLIYNIILYLKEIYKNAKDSAVRIFQKKCIGEQVKYKKELELRMKQLYTELCK